MPSGKGCSASQRSQHRNGRQSRVEKKLKKDAAKEERQAQWSGNIAKDALDSVTRDKPVASPSPPATAQELERLAPFAGDDIEAIQSSITSIEDRLFPESTDDAEPIQDSPSQPETTTNEEAAAGNGEQASVDENASSTGEDFSAVSSSLLIPKKPMSRDMSDILAMAEQYKFKYLSGIAAERLKSQNKLGVHDVDSSVQNASVASTLASAVTQKRRQLAPFATRTKSFRLSKRSALIEHRAPRTPVIKSIPSGLGQVPRRLVPFADTAQHVPPAKRVKTGETSYACKVVARSEESAQRKHIPTVSSAHATTSGEVSHVRNDSAPSRCTNHAKTSPSRVVAIRRTIEVPGQGSIYENDDFSQEWSLFMRNPRLWLRRLLTNTFGSLRQVPSMVARIGGRKRNAEEAFLDATDVIPETQHTHAIAAPKLTFRDVTEAAKAHDRAIKESQALARNKQLDDEAELERQREAEDKTFINWRLREMVKHLKQSTQRRNAVKARQEEDAISSKMQAAEVLDDDFDYLADLLGTSMNEEELLYLLKCAEDGVLPMIELSAQNIHKAWALLQNQKFATKEPALHAHLCLHMVPVLERLQFKLFASTLHALNLFDEELMVMYHFLSEQTTFDFAITPTTAARAQYLSFHPLIRDQYPQLAMAIEAKARFAVSVLQQSESMDADISIESPAAVATPNDTVIPAAGVQSVSWTPLAMDGVITDAARDESLANSPGKLATSDAFSSSTTVAAHQLTAMSGSPVRTAEALPAVTSSENSLSAPITSGGNVQASANRVLADPSISLKAKEGTLRLKLERIRDQVEPQVGKALKSNNGPAYKAAVLNMTKDLIEARNFANDFHSSSFDKFLDEQDPCEDTGVPRKQFWIGGGHLKDYENKEKTLTAKMQYIRTQLEPELATPWTAGDMATAAPLIAKMTNALIEAKNIANVLGSSPIDDFLKEEDPIDPDSNPREDFWAERVYGV